MWSNMFLLLFLLYTFWHAKPRFYKLERVMGIEPTYQAWEARVLPLNYTRKGWISFKSGRE